MPLEALNVKSFPLVCVQVLGRNKASDVVKKIPNVFVSFSPKRHYYRGIRTIENISYFQQGQIRSLIDQFDSTSRSKRF